MAQGKFEHQESQRRFLFTTPEGVQAVLLYNQVEPQLWELYHTEVPAKYRGHGIAAVLADLVFSWLRDNNIKANVTCSYLQYFLVKNPQFSSVSVD